MRIRTQIAAALLGMVAFSFLLAGLIGYQYARDIKSSIVGYLGKQNARMLAVVSGRTMITHDNELTRTYINSLRLSPSVDDAYVVGPRGRILFHVRPGLFIKAKDYAPDPRSDPLLFAHRIYVRERQVGTVRVKMAHDAYRSVFNEVGQNFLPRIVLLAGLALALGLGGSLLLAYLISRPIQHLLGGVRELGGGNLDVQVPVSGAKELGDLAGQFNDMAAKLRSLDELKDEWISKVSHDVRSPMGAVKMYADYMLHEDPERDKLLPKHKEMLAIIEDNALRLNVFVSNLLDAAKMKAGRMEYHCRSVDAEALLKNVQTLYAMVAQQRKVSLSVRTEPNLPALAADPEPFDRVIFNLVSNALKFTDAGGRVILGAKKNGDFVELAVSDTGKGIPQEMQAHLFERFYQAEAADQKSRRIQGTGLGLYIVKQTVEGMGGRIEVASEPGKGTRFNLLMPIHREKTSGQG